jgi:phage baseplate assembly protein W
VSYDLRLEQLCPHGVREEILFVDTADRRTVRPLRPIASAQSVGVRLNGAFHVPSEGVGSPAGVRGSREGPFSIGPANGVLRVVVNGGAVQTVTLAPAERLSASRVADLLNASLRGLLFSAEGPFVRVRTEQAGRDASLYILASSPLAGLVGFAADRSYRGRLVAPGWTLVSDPTTLADRPTRLVVFDEPLPGFRDFVEIDYVTVREECRRCGGIGVENDWTYGGDGLVALARDEDLLRQEFQKAVLTVRGSNPFHPWYGSTLLERIGQKSVSQGIVRGLIASDVQQVFARWQSIKREQEQRVQAVSDEEFPDRLLGVEVEQSSTDPTVLFVSITIQNRSRRPIQLTRGLRLPEPLEISGAAQSGGRVALHDFALAG